MSERQIELRRRRHRKEKMPKLKAKLAKAKEGREKDNILRKIVALSPTWLSMQTKTQAPPPAPAKKK
jgi:hypothetical protein